MLMAHIIIEVQENISVLKSNILLCWSYKLAEQNELFWLTYLVNVCSDVMDAHPVFYNGSFFFAVQEVIDPISGEKKKV